MTQCGPKEEPLPTPKGEFSVEKQLYVVNKEMTVLEVKGQTSMAMVDWKADQGSTKWLSISRRNDTDGQPILTIRISANTTPEKRSATISILQKSDNELLTSFVIEQDGDYSVRVDEDTKVTPTGATCADYQSGADIAKSIDGNMETMYHSRWSGTSFPVNIEYTFSGKSQIDYVIYYPRTSGSNGNFGKLAVYVATTGKNYEKVGDFDFGEKGSLSIVEIPGAKKPTAIKFEVKSGGGNFASCAEMEFYTRASGGPVEQSLLKVFKDLTLTELKDGVKDSDIAELQPFFQKTALGLKNNTYDEYEKEFRIQEYKPFSNNEEWAKKLMTKAYTSLDNPTGISVKEGDEIVVCVGDTYGQTISLQSIWEEKTGGDTPYVQTQASGISYPLKQGVNKLTMKGEGQLFLMYNCDLSSPNAKPVKVHILPGSGVVTGYFDLNKHKTDEKYRYLLGKATHKYFCVRGNKIMFYFHRSKMTPSILSAITLWDDIIGWQHELMGLESYFPKQFNNHIFAISPEGSYMWASSYRVAFVYTYLNNILLKENVMAAEDNAWGPAHEIGHVNQLAINWASCSESSNNLFSNYTIYKLGKYKSRGRGLAELARTRYVLGQSWYNLGDATHMNEDTETHMRMNWQLWNYFHRVLGQNDFFPKLFGLMRELGLNETSDCGRKQIEFAKRASAAAGVNLTDFFELWGFFVPVDSQIEQYGTYTYRVTQAQINEAKTYMSQFPKPKHALEYIEDRRYTDFPASDRRYQEVGNLGHFDTYKSNAKVAASATATVSGSKVTTKNCENAVAIEIRKGGADGDLKYFSNFLTFTIPAGVSTTGCGVYAVQADGTRILLSNL